MFGVIEVLFAPKHLLAEKESITINSIFGLNLIVNQKKFH